VEIPMVRCSDPFCTRCLHMGHAARDCRNPVRCWACHAYGHIRKNCFQWKAGSKMKWSPKSIPLPGSIESRVDGTKAYSGVKTQLHPLSDLTAHLPQTKRDDLPALPNELSNDQQSASMANFAIDPTPFIPLGIFPEDGVEHRHARRTMYIRGGIIKVHEDYAIAISHGDGELTPAQRHQLLHDITHYINVEVQQLVRSFAPHPHGVGIFRMRNDVERDVLVSLNPHFIGNRQISFVPHDEAPMNFRSSTFTRKAWIMLLVPPGLKDF
jgi:hypothetical protein